MGTKISLGCDNWAGKYGRTDIEGGELLFKREPADFLRAPFEGFPPNNPAGPPSAERPGPGSGANPCH